MKRKYSQSSSQISHSDHYNSGNGASLRGNNIFYNNEHIQNTKIDKVNKGHFYNINGLFSYTNKPNRTEIEPQSRKTTNSSAKRNTNSVFSRRRNLDFQKTEEGFIDKNERRAGKNAIEFNLKGNSSNEKIKIEENVSSDKKKNTELNKSLIPLEDCVSEGIKSQIMSSQMGRQELVLLAKSIISLFNIKEASDEDKIFSEKTQCMLYLDYLELRARKISKAIEIYSSEKLFHLGLINTLSEIMKVELGNIKDLMNDRLSEESDIQSFWSRCEALSEKINLMKKRKDIEEEIKSEKFKCEEIELEITEKRVRFEEKLKKIDEICSLVTGLSSK
ncbi:hypothetical protein FG386_000833 [Cryptosporidium ryanae]|uniref:uncharacterized protein n=1 Tax=Cryptosporidium ryanae TaxID=515981 RepID=UPI003519DE8E|nr:hypothetical protein FG386_000833 [Cryptosporidium ryanae]